MFEFECFWYSLTHCRNPHFQRKETGLCEYSRLRGKKFLFGDKLWLADYELDNRMSITEGRFLNYKRLVDIEKYPPKSNSVSGISSQVIAILG